MTQLTSGNMNNMSFMYSAVGPKKETKGGPCSIQEGVGCTDQLAQHEDQVIFDRAAHAAVVQHHDLASAVWKLLLGVHQAAAQAEFC